MRKTFVKDMFLCDDKYRDNGSEFNVVWYDLDREDDSVPDYAFELNLKIAQSHYSKILGYCRAIISYGNEVDESGILLSLNAWASRLRKSEKDVKYRNWVNGGRKV